MATPGTVRSPRLTESTNAQWEQSPRLRQIKMKLHKFREYVRIYLLSNVEVTRDNSVYVSVMKENIPERPYMMHKVCKQATNLQIYDYFLKDPRPMEMDDNVYADNMDYYIDNCNVYSEEDSDSDKSDSESDIFGAYNDNMMLPLNTKKLINKNRTLNDVINTKNVYFKFKFKCLHRRQQGYSSEMTEFGEKEYQFHVKFHAMLVIAHINTDQASMLEVDAGRPSYIPVVHLFNHWLNDLQILTFNHVITFVNDIITTSRDIDELICDSASISTIVSETLSQIRSTWDKYPDDQDIDKNMSKHYAHNASYQSNLSEDPFELRNRYKGKDKKEFSEQINELKKILFRKFLFLFVIGSKIDYHHIRQNKKDKNYNYKRVFDCSLLYWFVRSIYYFQRASIPYILALFRDECDIMGLNMLWEAIQINVKCCSDFETFLYLAPFINFFDAIDCFLRSSDQKRSIQSPEILKSNQRTQRTAKLVLKMIEIDLNLPVPSNRRFPVEGILLAKMSKRSQHQSEFINLLKTIQKTTSYWDDKEKTQYLTSMFQRHHSTISRILDWNWLIHDHYYSFCQLNEVLQIGIATQEQNLVNKMREMQLQQFNDNIFREFVAKWYESIFNQRVTDALRANRNIDIKKIKKFLRRKVRESVSALKSPSLTIASAAQLYRYNTATSLMGPKTGSMMANYNSSQNSFKLNSPVLAGNSFRLQSASFSSNNHTFDWFTNGMLNETSDAIILMIENFIKQRKDELALHLLRHLLCKHNNDIFDQLSVLIANQHYYRLPAVFQQLLGKILTHIHWFPPKDITEVNPAAAALKDNLIPGSPITPNWGHPDVLASRISTRDLVLTSITSSRNIQQSCTSWTDEKDYDEKIPLPPSPARTALSLASNGHTLSPNLSRSSRRIRPGSILDNKRKSKEKRRHKLTSLLGTSDFPLDAINTSSLQEDEDGVSLAADNDGMILKMTDSLTPQSNVAIKAISPNYDMDDIHRSDDDIILYFTTHILTFEEKKEMMLWLDTNGCSSQDIEMYSFWDCILMNIMELPDIAHITGYDASLYSDASQILSPKITSTINNHFDDEKHSYLQPVSQDPDESRIDLFLAYIMNEYDQINERGSNIYKLNVLHNHITLILGELEQIIVFGLRCKQIVASYDTGAEKEKLLFLTETFKPWIIAVMKTLYDQLKSGHLLVKTLEYIATIGTIETKLRNVLTFAEMKTQFEDLNIKQRLTLLKNVQKDIGDTKYTDDLKQRIKQNIVQWDYLTLLQLDQLITTLLNGSKAPTHLRVIDRVGNILRLHWIPPQGQLEYVKYEISQQLCRKEEDEEYLDPSTHLLGTFNVNKPPIQITIDLTNLVIICVSKPVVATNCLLRIRGVTNKAKQEIKSAWSDAINVAVLNTESIEHNISRYVQDAQKSMDQNVDFYALQSMIDDGFNYEKSEMDAILSAVSKQINDLEIVIKDAKQKMMPLKTQENDLQNRKKSLPIHKEKCNESLDKLNNIYTLSVHELEDKVENWCIKDCLYWFDRVGLCRFSKYHSILQSNLNAKYVQNFLNFTNKDLNELGITRTDNDNDSPRILHYISKCKKRYIKRKEEEQLLQRKHQKQQQKSSSSSVLQPANELIKHTFSTYNMNNINNKTHPTHKSSSSSSVAIHKKHPTNVSSASMPIHAIHPAHTKNPSSSASLPTHQKHVSRASVPPPPPLGNFKAASVDSTSSVSEPSPSSNLVSPPRSPREPNKKHNYNINGLIAQPRTNYHNPLTVYHRGNSNNFNSYNRHAQYVYNHHNKQLPPGPVASSNNMNPLAQAQQIQKVQFAPPFPVHQYNRRRSNNITNSHMNYNLNHASNKNSNKNDIYTINGVAVPADFLCPISGKMMKEPVMAADGRTYDKPSMEIWLKTNNTSPVFVGQPLRNKFLMPYNELAGRINAFKMKHSIQ